MRKRIGIALVTACLTGLFAATQAFAGQYTRLQILLPGETAAPGTTSGKSGVPRAQVANIPFTLTVRACDDQWNTVTTVTDIVEISSTDQSATLPPDARLSSGTRTFAVTLNATGTFTMVVHDQSDGTIPDGASAGVLTQVLKGFKFSPNPGSDEKAGVPFRATVTALDPAGRVVTGFYGTVNLKELTTFGDGPCSPDAVTLSAGSWSGDLTVFRADETAKGANLYGWYAPLPGVDGSSNGFDVHPGAVARLQILLPGQTAVPGSPTGLTGTPADQVSGTGFSVNVYSTDTWWNRVNSDDNVELSSSDPLGNTPLTGRLNHNAYTFTVVLGTVGMQTLTVTDTQNTRLLGMTSDAIRVLPSGTHHFEVNTIASPQTAGVPVVITVRATDKNSNTVTGFSGQAVLIANTGVGSMSPELVTFTSGVWTGPAVFKGAGALVRFNVTDFASIPHTGVSNSFTVQAGPLAKLQVLLPGESPLGGTAPGKTGTPTGQRAGQTFTTTVRAVDAYWNQVAGVNDVVALGSSDQFAWLPAETTLVDGQLQIPTRLALSGQQRIWASDVTTPSVSPDTSSAVTVTGGTFSRLLILAPGESPAPGTVSGRTGTATAQSVGYGFTVTVLAADDWWNPVVGPTDMVHLTTSDTGPKVLLPPDTAMVNGRVDMNVKLVTGGFQQITASDATQPSITSSTTQVDMIDSGFHLEASVSPASVGAGQYFTLTVKVTNTAGSVIQDVNSWVSVEVKNSSSGLLGRGTLLLTQFQLLQGQRSILENYTFAEPIILVVRDDAGNDPALTDVLDVHSGTPAAIVFTSDPTWVGGNKHATLSAQLTDAYGNGISGQTMAFRLLSGTGTLTPVDTTTDASGFTHADFLSSRTPEHDMLRASSDGISEDLELETALVDPNAAGGYVTNYPNPFRPPSEPTTIAWKLADDATVTLRIFSQAGGLVLEKTFARGAAGGLAGLNQWAWDGRNGAGSLIASGGYLLLIEAKGTGETLHVIRRKLAAVR